jgi:raffinose/stachyose/melibiose transport system permease protein
VWLLPLFISLTTALQPEFDVLAGLSVLPHHITFSNFSTAWDEGDLAQYYKNSILIVVVKVPLGVALASLAAFPLARYRFRGRKAVLMLFLLGLGITPLVVLYPLTILLKHVGIGGTLWSLLFPYLAFGLPFEILVMRGAFLGIPFELIEAARVDGAGELWIWAKVIMPLVRPVVGSLVLLDAVATWNEFVIALILINEQSARTLQLGLLNFEGTFSSNVSVLSATLRRHLVRGIAGGALKF